MIRRRNNKKSRAASILEFVLVLPFFLMLMMLVVDMGRVMMAHTEVNSALNAASRMAAVEGGATSDGYANQLFIAEFTPTAGVTASDVDVTVMAGEICTSATPHVTLNAEFDVELITPFLTQIVKTFSGSFSVDTTAVSRCEVIGRF